MLTIEGRSQCSRCRGCTSSTRLRGRHRRRSHLMYHRRTSPCIHRPRRSRTCTNRRGATAVKGSGSWPSMCAAGRDMAAARTSGPSQDATLASGAVGLRKSRTAQLLREAARAACAIGTRTRAASKNQKKLREKVSSEHANIGRRVVKISTIETEGRGFPTEPSECSLLTSPARAPLSGKLPPRNRKGREQHFYRNHRTSPKSCGKKSALNTQ